MARKKEMLVKDVLKMVREDEEVVITFFAYGIFFANSWNDGLHTVKECLEGLNIDCMNARVGRIGIVDNLLCFGAEMIH